MAELADLLKITKSFKPKPPVVVEDGTALTKGVRRSHFDPAGALAPYVTTGEVYKDSRGYSLIRATQAYLSGDWADAKLELDVHKTLLEKGYPRQSGILVPLDSRRLTQEVEHFRQIGLNEAVAKGVAGADPEYLRALYQEMMIKKALGESIDTAGGFLVRPERSSEMIDLLREGSLLGRTSIREIALPKSGKLEFNKTTKDVQWVPLGENQNIKALVTQQPELGQVNLNAKKAGGFVALSNELIADSTPSAEAWVRELYGMSLAEYVNEVIINGSGFRNEPRGILNTPGITVRLASTTGANGDTFEPEDPALAISDVGEAKGKFTQWIMRPVMTAVIRNRRADAVVAGDKKGVFLFTEANGPKPSALQGYPIAETVAVPNTKVKGSAGNLTTIIGGMLSQVVYGRMATLEITASREASDAFVNDQTWLRALIRHDVQVGIAGAIVVFPTLLQQ